jgi:alpha-galactosidase/6-phospho-beta-glucosidase family protein
MIVDALSIPGLQSGEFADAKPKLLEAANTSKIYEQDIIRFEMLKHFGAFPTESSGHFSEYVPYFRKRPDLLEKYTRAAYKGESGFYARNGPQWRSDHDLEVKNLIAKELAGEDAIVLEQNREAAFHAVLLDSLSAAVCSPQEIREVFEELVLAEADHLPAFMKR